MKRFLTAAVLSAGLLTANGTSQAADPPSGQSEELTATASSLVIGRITQIDGQTLLVQEDRGEPVRVQVTQDTLVHNQLNVGDEVIVSLLENGVAAVITTGQTEADASILDGNDRDAR